MQHDPPPPPHTQPSTPPPPPPRTLEDEPVRLVAEAGDEAGDEALCLHQRPELLEPDVEGLLLCQGTTASTQHGSGHAVQPRTALHSVPCFAKQPGQKVQHRTAPQHSRPLLNNHRQSYPGRQGHAGMCQQGMCAVRRQVGCWRVGGLAAGHGAPACRHSASKPSRATTRLVVLVGEAPLPSPYQRPLLPPGLHHLRPAGTKGAPVGAGQCRAGCRAVQGRVQGSGGRQGNVQGSGGRQGWRPRALSRMAYSLPACLPAAGAATRPVG